MRSATSAASTCSPLLPAAARSAAVSLSGTQSSPRPCSPQVVFAPRCGHAFHSECLLRVLAFRTYTCPQVRAPRQFPGFRRPFVYEENGCRDWGRCWCTPAGFAERPPPCARTLPSASFRSAARASSLLSWITSRRCLRHRRPATPTRSGCECNNPVVLECALRHLCA